MVVVGARQSIQCFESRVGISAAKLGSFVEAQTCAGSDQLEDSNEVCSGQPGRRSVCSPAQAVVNKIVLNVEGNEPSNETSPEKTKTLDVEMYSRLPHVGVRVIGCCTVAPPLTSYRITMPGAEPS